jgi:hypothetical protein
MPGPGQCQVVPSFLREYLELLSTPHGRAELSRRERERDARELEEQRRRDAEWTRRLADGRWNRCARRWASKHSKGVV